MLEIIDEFCWEKHKKVITFDYHGINGLRNFAHWSFRKSIIPTPMHYHTDIVEIHCLVKGKRISNVNDISYNITGNEMFVTFPFERHSTGFVSQHPCEFYAFQIDLKHKDDLLGLNKEISNALYYILTNLEGRHFKFEASHIVQVRKAFGLFSKKDKISIYLGVQYLCCFLFSIPNFNVIANEGVFQYDIYIKKSIKYIEDNFRSEIKLTDVAKTACLSLSRFKSKFKEEVGMTPAEYITFRKIEYARTLLEDSDMSVTDIALQSGFSSSNYFCSVFRKFCNSSPTEFRKCIENRKNQICPIDRTVPNI